MKILQVIEALTRGGAERLVIELAEEFQRRDIENSVLCLSSPGEWAAQLEDKGLYAGCLNKRHGADIRIAGRLRKRIREIAPDIVHSHLFTANLWVRLASLGARKWGLVATLHNIDKWRTPLQVAADRLLTTAADRYVAVSGAVADYYMGCGLGRRLRVIPNGVYWNGATPRKPLEGRVPVVRACGRIVANKGFSVLIRAAAILRDRKTVVKIEIIGDGPGRTGLEAEIGALGLEQHVALLGEREDARSLIADADVFVLPSLTEGLPLVVLEAMFAGRPIVASDLPGLRGVIVDSESAFVVQPGSAEMLAKALGAVLSSPESARALGRVARARAKEDFSIERAASSYLELYKEVLERRAG